MDGWSGCFANKVITCKVCFSRLAAAAAGVQEANRGLHALQLHISEWGVLEVCGTLRKDTHGPDYL